MKPLSYNQQISVGILLVILILIISSIHNDNLDVKRKENINAHRYETIAKVTDFSYPDGSKPYYDILYFYNGKKFKSAHYTQSGRGKSCIGKYYKLELSTQNPEYTHLLFNQEVTDTVLLKKAGFLKNK